MAIKATDHAVAYAAQKSLEAFLKEDCLPFGETFDVSGRTITLTFAQGTTVSRDAGLKGDGLIAKKATTDFYGYGLWAIMMERLAKFNQWNAIKQVVIDAMREVRRNKQVQKMKVGDAMNKLDPELAKAIETLKTEFPIQARMESTARILTKKLDPTIIIE